MAGKSRRVTPFVRHPGLVSGAVEARAYQLQALDESISGSMLLVLPTSAGKTAVAMMAIAESLVSKDGWVLVVAPTVALVNQHLKSAQKMISDVDGLPPISISGSQSSQKRALLWGSSRLIIATPHVVRNDALRGSLSLDECSLMVVDEAHHCTGEHAMAKAASLYVSNCPNPLVLATTASPGSSRNQVEEVCAKLGIRRIHLRTNQDPMISGYLSNLEISETRVDVPRDIKELVVPFELWLQGIVEREKRLGRYVMTGVISHSGLSNAMERAQAAISRGDSSGYRSSSQIATAMRINHLINHLLCQGIAASRRFLKRMDIESSRSRSAKSFLTDPRVNDLKDILEGMPEIHSKVSAVRRLVRERIRHFPDSRIIVFANYRDTVEALEGAIKDLEGVRPIQFIGQASRGGSGGLTAKEQIERLEKFRSGEKNILVATSVGEEGLDIPSADLVVFYEPVSSEIRTIQRRGRTGRKREGSVAVLIAEGTRDEGAMLASSKKEFYMNRAVRRVSRSLTSVPQTNLSNISKFKVDGDFGTSPASDFVIDAREKSRMDLSEKDETPVSEREVVDQSKLSPERFRPSGQTGLENY